MMTITPTSLITTFVETCSGRRIALIPRTRPIFARLDPITLPTARSGLPRRDATIEITSSGADVPMETTVRPTTIGLTPSERASLEAPRTSHSAPKHRTPTPPTKSRMSRVTRSSPDVVRATCGIAPGSSCSRRPPCPARHAAPDPPRTTYGPTPGPHEHRY